MTPIRGEVWTVDLGLAQKLRPAVILSTEFGDNDRALITIVPHTTALRNSEFEVAVDAHFLKTGAFIVQGITSVDPSYAKRRLGFLTQEQMSKIEDKLRSWLRV